MKKLIFTVVACLALVCVGFAQSKVVKGTVSSKILNTEKPYVVYLPAGYDSAASVKYPVLYLLHGAWGTCDNWTQLGYAKQIADQTIALGTAVPMIIVMPDARGKDPKNFGGKHMGYFNQPGWNYEDFFFEEFVPEIEKRYNVDSRKEMRAISGLSMGGGGSAAYAQRHPDMFASAAPLSGLLGDFDGSKAKGFDPDFDKSIMETAPLTFVQNATPEQVEGLKSVRWYIDCGDDDYLYEANVKIYLNMRKLGIPLQFRMRDGVHNWVYWSTALPDVLQFITVGFNQAK